MRLQPDFWRAQYELGAVLDRKGDTASAVEHLTLGDLQYIPGYRTPAGTGTGMCFADWQ